MNTRLLDKLKNGEIPTDEDWAEYLQEAHRLAPSMTPDAFSAHSTADGVNSYAKLARHATGEQILDLGCGDGHLIPHLLKRISKDGRVVGVDMSEDELRVARQQILDPRVTFYCAKAQQLPLAEASVDSALSHMAFMLMRPLAPVVRELGRVIRPGGSFTAVIDGGAPSGLFAEVMKITQPAVESYLPGLRERRLGGKPLGSAEGLGELFAGFGAVENFVDFDLQVQTDADGLWSFMRNAYFVAALPAEVKEQLRFRLEDLGRISADTQGRLSFLFPMRLLQVKRAN